MKRKVSDGSEEGKGTSSSPRRSSMAAQVCPRVTLLSTRGTPSLVLGERAPFPGSMGAG